MAGLGRTFRRPGQHLWVVVSDPANRADGICLCVNLTDAANYHGDGFFLNVGDHVYIKKKSVLYFPEAMLTTQAKIDANVAKKALEECAPFEGKVLSRIIEKCKQTTHLPQEFRPYLHPAVAPKETSPEPQDASPAIVVAPHIKIITPRASE